jgi:hypothetical protein
MNKFGRHMIVANDDSWEFAEIRAESVKKGALNIELAYGGANTRQVNGFLFRRESIGWIGETRHVIDAATKASRHEASKESTI